MQSDEQRLIERLRRRDEAAFNAFVRAHQQAVFRLLRSMLGDAAEAEDVAQEVFVSVFKAIDGFRGDASLSTWLYRIAINHGKNRLKYLARRARDAQRPLEERDLGQGPAVMSVPRPVPPDQLAEGREAERTLDRAMRSLDDDQRQLLVLRDIEHLSYDEIRELTGLPIGTVKSRLHRARLALHTRYRAMSEDTP